MSSAPGGGGVQPLSAHDPDRIGPYTLLGRLGAGGMGRVYLARAESGRMVAVKVVHEEHAAVEEFQDRFRREIRAARRVGGEYTADFLDADTETNPPWVATSYVPGPSLEKVVREYGALPAQTVFALAEGLARALDGIHSAGIVHRDLKPSNVMLTVEGPRVIDFGIARAIQPSAESMLTSTGMVIGSPGFMAPEQVLGESVGPAADVFVLGCVLAYAATGVLPFGKGAQNQHAVMYRIVEGEPDLAKVDDEALRTLLTRLLTKEVAERPTVDVLLAEFGEQPVSFDDELWLPPKLVAHLARHTAQLLAVDTPRRVGEPGGAGAAGSEGERADGAGDEDAEEAAASKPVDVATVDLRGKPPAEGDPAKKRPSRRRTRALIAGAVALVLALGGTAAFLDRFGDDGGGGSGRDDQAAPADSPTPSGSGGSEDPKESDDPEDDEKDDKKDKDDKDDKDKDGKDKDGDDSKGKDNDEAGGGGSGSDSGGSSGSGGGSGDGSGSGSGGGGNSGGNAGGGGDKPSDPGNGNAIPQSFVGTWTRSSQYGPGPFTIRIQQASKGQRAAYMTTGNGSVRCVRAATFTEMADGGKRLRVGTAKVVEKGSPSAFCAEENSGTSFTLGNGGLLRTAPNGSPDGNTYTRG